MQPGCRVFGSATRFTGARRVCNALPRNDCNCAGPHSERVPMETPNWIDSCGIAVRSVACGQTRAFQLQPVLLLNVCGGYGAQRAETIVVVDSRRQQSGLGRK